jgi:hypothetical protein
LLALIDAARDAQPLTLSFDGQLLDGRRSNGLTAGRPSGAKCRVLRVKSVSPRQCAVAAIAISANPGADPLLLATSDKAPAMRAAARSKGRMAGDRVDDDGRKSRLGIFQLNFTHGVFQ